MIPWFNIEFPSIPFPIIGKLTIHAFGILVAIGILVGLHLTKKRGRELGLVDEKVDSMVTWTLVCGFILAHLFDVFAYQQHATWRDILNPVSGFSSFGGFAGALIGLFSWTRYYKQPVMPYADSLAYGLATGWMFGRLGCFTAHDHPGLHTTFFLAVRYPDGPRHDLGLDEALWAFCVTMLFVILHKTQGERPRRLGLYVGLLTTLYGPVRFGLDFLRATDVPGADPRYAGLTPAQWLSILVCVAGIGLLVRAFRHKPAEA